MKRAVIGILAHVDSGKTTLSEALLYLCGGIRSLGRVDKGNSFLDNNYIERERGITIFSKQAELVIDKDTCFTLIDTPGHVDFGAEAERTMQILDYAILVVSGTDGIQSHTQTLWKLLKSYNIPTFVFVNKMDISHYDEKYLMENISQKLGFECVSFQNENSDEFFENISVCDEYIMEEFLEKGQITKEMIAEKIAERKIVPCIFGSALKLSGTELFLEVVKKYVMQKPKKDIFSAKVYKISDDKCTRITHLKVTGGELSVKSLIFGEDNGKVWEEKVNEIRVYSGDKYKNVNRAEQGMVVGVTGLTKTFSGQGLGNEKNSSDLSLEPVFSYKVILPDGVSETASYMTLKKLNEEETKLNVYWDAHLKEIRMELMGQVQIEVLKKIIADRFDLEVEFEQGGIVYKETIEETVEGVGHYEPLRHYAEVHLIMEPAPVGSGLKFISKCREDDLSLNWQRLILTHLKEKTHIGCLTGSPITDMNIILASGRAHQKHTDGGDFRQATYRAVRHGLRCAKSVLLEPWYNFYIEVPSENMGRVMNDITQMGGSFEAPLISGEISILEGSAPVSKIRDYQSEIVCFSGGRGKINCTYKGYEKCQNSDEVIEKIGYDCDSDIENTADSVFCSHGASVVVNWSEVLENMHLESALQKSKIEEIGETERKLGKRLDLSSVSDDELSRIFEMTFGKPRERSVKVQTKKQSANGIANEAHRENKSKKREPSYENEYLLVDGYNIIFDWESLKELARENIDLARARLISRLVNYRAVKDCNVILVFDAYKVKNNLGSIENIDGISIVYTKEAETADTYIERVTHELSKHNLVRVATSDGLEQLIILGNGALRLSAKAFEKEVLSVEKSIEEFLKNQK